MEDPKEIIKGDVEFEPVDSPEFEEEPDLFLEDKEDVSS